MTWLRIEKAIDAKTRRPRRIAKRRTSEGVLNISAIQARPFLRGTLRSLRLCVNCLFPRLQLQLTRFADFSDTRMGGELAHAGTDEPRRLFRATRPAGPRRRRRACAGER